MDATSPIFQKIKQHILAGDPQPGDRVPTETELMNVLGLSRYMVREALTILVQMGIVERSPRRGTVVKKVDASDLSNKIRYQFELVGFDEAEFLDARLMVECAILPFVAQRMTPATEAQMKSLIAGIRSHAGNPLRADEFIRDFHLLLLSACGNRIMEVFSGVLRTYFQETTHLIEKMPASYFTGVADLFSELLAMLKEQDSDGAARLMKHLITEKAKELAEHRG